MAGVSIRTGRASARVVAPGITWLVVAVMCLTAIAPAARAAGDDLQASQPAQEEFVPIDELPPEERLPAAPLLIAAYAFVWMALLAYVWSVWRRMSAVERELRDVERRMAERQDR